MASKESIRVMMEDLNFKLNTTKGNSRAYLKGQLNILRLWYNEKKFGKENNEEFKIEGIGGKSKWMTSGLDSY